MACLAACVAAPVATCLAKSLATSLAKCLAKCLAECLAAAGRVSRSPMGADGARLDSDAMVAHTIGVGCATNR
jgi:hypothetical protein